MGRKYFIYIFRHYIFIYLDILLYTFSLYLDKVNSSSQRLYYVGTTGSHSITKVKIRWAQFLVYLDG